jgi:hypothetical protein
VTHQHLATGAELEVAVANDKIARRYSGLAERLTGVIA